MDRNDGCDLNEVERIKIDRTYDRLQRINYYEILNLPQQANRAQIKKSYYTVSKEFHPDRYFRRTLGAYKERLEAIFDLITKAYNTLNDDEQRAEYDKSLIEQSMQRSPSMHEVSFDFGGATPAAGSTNPSGATPATSRPAPAGVTPPGMPTDPGSRPAFMDKLQRQVLERMMKAREYFRTGKEAFDKGHMTQAVSALQMAVTYDANMTEAKQLLEKASSRVKEVQAEAHFQRGLQELMVGNSDNARQYLKMAVDCKPRKGYYYFKLGMLYLDVDQDVRQALEQLRLAIQFDPQNLEYLMALAKAYEDARMPRNAVRELEKVLAIDKSNDQAQKMLKRMKAAL